MKKALSIMMASSMVLSLAACSGSATSPTTVAPEPSKSAAEESKAEETTKAAVSGERMELTVWLTPSWKGFLVVMNRGQTMTVSLWRLESGIRKT